jgi:glycosyltransferase involved in cell wall biosynthesis
MKILHIATGYPITYPGGITNYVRTLMLSQVTAGDDVAVLTMPECDPAWSQFVQPYVPDKVVKFSLKTVESDSVDDEAWQKIAGDGYDIIHFHMSLDFSLGMLGRFAASSLRYVVSLHDYYYLCPRVLMVAYDGTVCRTLDPGKCAKCIGVLDQVNLLRKIAAKVKITLPRIPSEAAKTRLAANKDFLEKASLLLAVSNRTAEIYREVVPTAHLIVEHIGNESATHAPICKVPSSRVRAVFIGTLNFNKGAAVLETLLKRVRRADIEFHFYGRAFEGFEKRLRKLGLIFHGSYSPKQIPSIMENADLGLVLSIWEDNGPQVTMEFINYGVPVVGTRRGGIPDFIEEGSGIVFDPDNEEEVRGAIDWIDTVSMEQLQAMSARIKPLKTPEHHAQRVKQAYEHILNSVDRGSL